MYDKIYYWMSYDLILLSSVGHFTSFDENLKQLLISRTQSIQKKKETNENKSLRDLTLEKQSKEKKEEMDNLVKNLLLED